MVEMRPQAVSNQLQRDLFSDQGILSNVRNGTNIHYRIVDPCTMSLLDQGLCLSEDTWKRRSNMSIRGTGRPAGRRYGEGARSRRAGSVGLAAVCDTPWRLLIALFLRPHARYF